MKIIQNPITYLETQKTSQFYQRYPNVNQIIHDNFLRSGFVYNAA